MHATEQTIDKLLPQGGTERYCVPAYQRPYCWERDNVEQLLQDILDSCESADEEYFIGSLICFKINEHSKFEIVDGQQRLVSLTLILKSLSEIVNEEQDRQNLLSRIIRMPAFGSEHPAEPVLEVRQEVRGVYRNIMSGEDFDGKPTNAEKTFMENYACAQEFFKDLDGVTINRFITHLLFKVQAVFVKTEDEKSAFRLFNVLNNRGIPLSDADLVKNHLFQLASGSQHAEIEERWRDVEKSGGGKHMYNILRLLVHSQKTTRDQAIKIDSHGRQVSASVFEYFKHRLQHELHRNSSMLLAEIERAAEIGGDVLAGAHSAKKNIALLKNFDQMEWMPACIAFLRNPELESKFVEFIALFEKAYVQRVITRNSPKIICYYALEAINTGKSFVEIAGVLRGQANDAEFERAFDVDVYRTGKFNKMIVQILRRVNESSFEKVEVATPTQANIEHIMPQNSGDPYWQSWRQRYPEVYDEWLHKLGNLTLLSGPMNRKVRNSGFDNKIKVYCDQKSITRFAMTYDLRKLKEWTPNAIQQRHDHLKSEIVKLWRIRP